jgi:hypothetical protein
MPKKVPNIQRIIINVILKIVNIVFSREAQLPPAPHCVRPREVVDIAQYRKKCFE